MHCTICGLPAHNIVGSVLPQCKCGWQAPQPPKAQRTWVGLTDEERKNIMVECESTGDWAWELNAAKAIEAKLKQKNGYAEEKNT